MSSLPSWILQRPLLQAAGDERSRWYALGITVIHVIASVTYGLLSDAPWDDDCIVRYFHTQELWSKPEYFFSVWDRPLFMILFAPTAMLGRTVMMLQMIAIGALAGWFLYRALHKLGARDAHWVLPFFYFQTFYFSVSRNFLTEPLAVAVICVGLHALVHKRWSLFAIMGGLLPLARLELAVVLPIWALILWKVGKWRSIGWMALPTLLVVIVGYFVKDATSIWWLVNDTLGREGKNRYGHRDVWHYFQRFAYVTGPVVFVFLVTGLLERLFRRTMDLFVTVQAMGILALYVIFSWKLDVGNSAGFLRNLIPLTPFVALLAFDGFTAWGATLGRRPAPEAPAPPASPVPRAQRKQKTKQARPVPVVAKPTNARWAMLRVHLFVALAIVLLGVYYTKVLEGHHKLGTTTDRTLLWYGAGILLLGVVAWVAYRTRPFPAVASTGLALLVGGATLAYTLHTEQPDAHLNPERKGITELSVLYKDSYLRKWPLYANHPWFFWPQDLGYPDPQQYRTLTKEALDTAAVHSVVLWENHYAHRLQGNVQLADLYKRADMVELCHLVGTDHRLTAGLFQKVDTLAKDRDALRSAFLAAYPNVVYGPYAEAIEHTRDKRFQQALVSAQRMMALDSTYVESNLVLGQCYFDLEQYDKAIAAFSHAMVLDTALFAMHYSIGASHFRAGRYPETIASMHRVIARNKKMEQAHETLGAAYYQLHQYDSASTAFTQLIRLNPKNSSGWLNRGNCYFQQNALDKALADYDQCLKVEPNNTNALMNKGILLVRKGDKAAGCALLHAVGAAGNAVAMQYAASLCR